MTGFTADMMLLKFQTIIGKTLALPAPIKVCYIKKDKTKFLLQEKGLCETKIQEIATKNLKTIYFVKEKNKFSQVL